MAAGIDFRVARELFDYPGKFDVKIAVAVQIEISGTKMPSSNQVVVSPMIVNRMALKYQSQFSSAELIEVITSIPHVGDAKDFYEWPCKPGQAEALHLKNGLFVGVLGKRGRPIHATIPELKDYEIAPPVLLPIADGDIQILFTLDREHLDPVERILGILCDCGIGKCLGDLSQIRRRVVVSTCAAPC